MNNKKPDKKEIENKLNLVIDKLMNLGRPDNDEELEKGGESIGFFKRDFGIKEWDWPQGVGLYGLLKIMQINGNDEYREFLYKWFKENIAEGLPSKNINTTTPLLTLVELNNYYNDTQFEELCIKWAEWLMNCLPRTKERGFQHVTSANGDRQGVRLNENEMWIDTLFMTVLFLNKMGQKYNRQDWINESIHQVLMHIKYLCDNKTGLFYHGWTFNEMNNFGGIFWCRGNSWFTLGILDYVDMFKGTLNSGVKEIIIDAYKAQTAALKKLQSKSGLWHTVLTDSSSYEEVSGRAAITAGILKGIRMGILDDSYIDVADKAINAILKNIDSDGTVLNVSGGTGMGYDAEHYKNILIAPMAYGQSLTILALVEALQNDKKSLRVGISSQEGIITPAYVCVECNNKQISPKYLFTLLHYYDSITKVMYKMGDGLRQTLSYRELKDLVIYIPSIDEQHYITDVFEEIDTYITIGNKMLASLKKIKEASLQSMFPHEGETVPKVRFNGFEGEWEQVRLKDISTKVVEKNKSNSISVTLTNSAEYGIIDQRDFFDHDVSNIDNISGYFVVQPRDFVYNPRISALAPVGPINMNKLGYSGVMSPLYYVFRVFGINKDFLDVFFRTNMWHKYMKDNGNTGARFDRLSISDELFREMPIYCPKDINEQKKIASYFRSIDRQIDLQTQRLKKLKQIKAACLDKMFV